MTQELQKLCERNFPFIVRSRETVREILDNAENIIIEERGDRGRLVGASVLHGNTILLLCVDRTYRNKGIGERLLNASEKAVRDQGYAEIRAGAGSDYIMPGVPTARRYFEAGNERLYPGLNEEAGDFFEKRGYTHSWECNCFDMRLPLGEFTGYEYHPGDQIGHIIYRWAVPQDMEAVCACANDAYWEFTRYYRNAGVYQPDSDTKVLAAFNGDVVVGVLLVDRESETRRRGRIGCTAVRPAYRGRHIAERMVAVGTGYLADTGVEEAFIGYTYSGLERLYGRVGYRTCIYYMMAVKML